jgi:hypothetical protein
MYLSLSSGLRLWCDWFFLGNHHEYVSMVCLCMQKCWQRKYIVMNIHRFFFLEETTMGILYHKRGREKRIHGWFDLDTCPFRSASFYLMLAYKYFPSILYCGYPSTSCYILGKNIEIMQENAPSFHSWGWLFIILGSLFHSPISILFHVMIIFSSS